eukprot:GDKI01025219.1.p1 GENE.GDKI01025219.1~~GDKI01025219.1.p1  ORF type:complete len:141 (+),score=18.62 GDKI01025219.1:38-424(+)
MGKQKKPNESDQKKKKAQGDLQQQRQNFLYQAAHCIVKKNENLARFYMAEMQEIARKNVTRLHPTIKRSACKGCASLLLYGSNCTVTHNEQKNSEHLEVKCHTCGRVKRICWQNENTAEKVLAGPPPE